MQPPPLVLRETAKQLGVERGGILAVGDNYNDLDMLDPEIAAHLGCPADAVPEVVDAVRAAGGIVGRQPGSAGAVEVIRQATGV